VLVAVTKTRQAIPKPMRSIFRHVLSVAALGPTVFTTPTQDSCGTLRRHESIGGTKAQLRTQSDADAVNTIASASTAPLKPQSSQFR
jgi:hypothetical protein